MGQVKVKTELLQYTSNPEVVVATAAKLCYSDAGIAEIREGVESKDISKFIQKLVDMNHLSPIEHASFTFGVEGVSRSLLAQLTRHRIASFSVKSQRYVRVRDFNYVIPPQIEALGEEAKAEYCRQMETMAGWYRGWVEKLEAGERGNEDARFVLPNAAETKLVMTMNARELMHFFSLRCCNRAQWEIREMAWQMLELVLAVAPALFKNAGPACVRGACSEGRMSCGRADEVRARQKALIEKTTKNA